MTPAEIRKAMKEFVGQDYRYVPHQGDREKARRVARLEERMRRQRRVEYRSFALVYDPKPIPDRSNDWNVIPPDYDGQHIETFEFYIQCVEHVDEILKEKADAENAD
jgi:hypothetical protein